MKRKFLSLFTAFAMLMSLFGAIPITASAAEDPHTHPICGASCTHEDEHTEVEWTPLTQAMIDSASKGVYNMPSGSYYLTEDITTENGITIGEYSYSNINANICFNGHTITCSNNQTSRTAQLYVNKNSSLTLCDCQGGGGFYSAAEVTRPLFWTDGSLNLYGGTLSGKSGTAYNTASSLNLYGGTLSNTTNTVHGSFTLDGAAIETTSYAIKAEADSTVRIKSGSATTSDGSPSVLVYTTDFTMEGGNITNTNTKTTGNSYAIEFSSLGGSGTISGGVIQATGPTGSGIYVAGPNVVLSGNPTIEGTNADIRIGTNGKLTVDNNLEGQYSVAYSSPDNITEDAPYSFTTDDSKDNSAYFKDSVLSTSGLALRSIGEGSEQTVQIYRPHLLKAYSAKAATCTETGNDAYWKCTNTECGKLFSDADGETEIDSIPTINTTGHSWGDWTITAEPTLTTTGTAERVCTKDGEHKDTFNLPVLTDTTVWTVGTKVEPTETTDGSQEYTSDYGTVTITIPATGTPTASPSAAPTAEPTAAPTTEPTSTPPAELTATPTSEPTSTPTAIPSVLPTAEPTAKPTAEPTSTPTPEPTSAPTSEPTGAPTVEPTSAPTSEPTGVPTVEPTGVPTTKPTDAPTIEPTVEPTTEPTASSTAIPTASPASECFDIDGTVVDKDNNGVANVKLSLKRGNTTVTAGEAPIETTTDTNGEFKFIGIASGVYNIVAEYTEGDSVITVTSLAEVRDRSISIILMLPEHKANSILKLEGDNTPDIIVGGLDELASENAQPSENVTITMTVESKAKDSDNSEHNKIEAISVNSNIDYFDIALTKTVDTKVSNISETNKLLTIIIPFNTNGKKNIKVYRYHGNGAAPLSDNPADGEYFSVSDGYIKVYASKFSTYAIGYDTETSEPTAEPTDEPTPTPTPKRSTGSASRRSNLTTNPVATPAETAEPTVVPTQEPVQTDEVKQHKAYIVGYEGNFRPDGNITRAETAAILARLTDGFDENGSYTPSLTDVANDLWYYKYIGFEESENVITGYSDGEFKPENNITRAEFAAMIVKFSGLDASSEAVPFTDTDGHWATEQIAACYEAGYIKGYEDNTFLPDNYITRAEAVSIINRVLDRKDIKDFENPFIDVTESHWAYADIMEASITHNAADN